ncbi:hypothetical protein EIP91_008921 [Steccherinum ochraceum]|uniref:Uncharacterized protein n=1 Tax=Steccherinum ochraceum TaxID=92696 RepID=A0A4R0RRK9_9APHY|nr:hypothetical protein EIP91_008921 [Steccherinum ochraceum]
MAPTLRELLQEPFGPYADDEVLAETLKSTRTKMLGLHQVRLTCRGESTGLTKCEASQPEFNTGNHRVHVEGVLVIRKLGWLSPEGLQIIQRDLQARDRTLSSLTLRTLYGGTNTMKAQGLKIRIKAVKNMAAVFLHSSSVLYGLLVKTETRYRSFEVLSMDTVTYKLSYKYLSRYRTLRVLKDIVRYDKENSEEPTPQILRNPRWFAAMYLRMLRRLEKDAVAVHLSSDTDNDSGSEDEDESHTIRPRIVRPLHHQTIPEVLVMLAKHVEWLVDDQKRRRKHGDRYFDVDVWERWIWTVKNARRRTRGDEDALLALFAEEEENREEEEHQSDVDPVPARSGLGKRKSTPAETVRSSTAFSAGDSGRSRSPSPFLSYMDSPPRVDSPFYPPPQDFDDDAPRHEYDSDFSPPSESGWEDSDASLPSRPPTPPPRDLLQRIPPVILHKPDLPKSFKWECPVDHCTYTLDLLRPNDDDWRDVPRYGKREFAKLKWKLKDGWVEQYFHRRVANHWKEHLDSQSIAILTNEDLVKFEWAEGTPQHSRARIRSQTQIVKPEQDH